VLCLDGAVRVESAVGSASLGAGQSVFVGGGEANVTVAGCGQVAIGRAP